MALLSQPHTYSLLMLGLFICNLTFTREIHMFCGARQRKKKMYRLDISNLSMVDVQYSDFESRFYALPVCWYKKLAVFSYLIVVTCMNEYKWFNSSRNDANQRSRRLEMPWLNIQRHWTFLHSLIQTISLLRYRNRKTTQYVLTKHLKPICIRQIRKKNP